MIDVTQPTGAVCRSGTRRFVSSVDCGVASAAITGRQDDRLRRSPCMKVFIQHFVFLEFSKGFTLYNCFYFDFIS